MAKIRVSQTILEAFLTTPTRSPTVPAAGNVAVSQAILEAFMSPTGSVRVSQAILEAFMSDANVSSDPAPCVPGSGGGVHVFGYAS